MMQATGQPGHENKFRSQCDSSHICPQLEGTFPAMTDAAADHTSDPLAGTNPDINQALVFEAIVDKIPDNLLLTMDGEDFT